MDDEKRLRVSMEEGGAYSISEFSWKNQGKYE
jgi:hypothetical protein